MVFIQQLNHLLDQNVILVSFEHNANFDQRSMENFAKNQAVAIIKLKIKLEEGMNKRTKIFQDIFTHDEI